MTAYKLGNQGNPSYLQFSTGYLCVFFSGCVCFFNMMMDFYRLVVLVLATLSVLSSARSLTNEKDERAFFYVPRLPQNNNDIGSENEQLRGAFFFKPRHYNTEEDVVVSREVKTAPSRLKRAAFFFIPGDQLPVPRRSAQETQSFQSQEQSSQSFHPPDCMTFCKGRCTRRGKCLPRVRSQQDSPLPTESLVIY